MTDLQDTPRPQKIAYIMSRFPKLTETFILFEMLAVEAAGTPIELYPLLRTRNTTTEVEGAGLWTKFVERFKNSAGPIKIHPEAAIYIKRAHFFPFLSFSIVLAQFYFLLTRPGAYFGTLGTIIRANLGSANYLIGALSIFPKSVYTAYHMQRNNITHVHAHFANHPAAAAYIIHRISGISYSFTAHGADFQVDQHMLTEKISESAFTIAISHANKKFIIDACGQQVESKIKILYSGVDTTVFTEDSCVLPPPNPDNSFTIVSIGTFYEVKGHTYLIEACRLLKERGLNFKAYLIGSGPYQAQLAQQVTESDLENHIIFHGQRTRKEIADILKTVDVSVLPSIPTIGGRQEGIPVVLMEAMASGVPVIASGISGIPELVKHEENGLLVPPKDPKALANAIDRLYGDVALQAKFGQAGRQTVLQSFDLYKNANSLIQMIEESNKP
jgi:colanic acid/amylovoran biosynthesis glycosyltransferase